MAEGAPAGPAATPSTAEPGGPSATPAPAPDIAAAPGPIDDAAASPATPPRKATKPIPTRPSLPGVYPDEDPFPSTASGATEGDGASASPPRGPDGRFVASPSSAIPPTSAGVHPSQPGAQDAPTPPPAPKFKFAGEEYASQQEAEQQVKSLRGQFKPIQSLARQLGGIERIPDTLTRASESARAWKAEADRRGAELEALRSGAPAGQATPATPPTPAPAAEPDVDWALYAEIRKLSTESGEPWKAEQWLIEETRKVERARTDRLLAERMAPYDQQQQQAETDARTTQLFGQLAQYSMADGSPAFPELNDEQSAYSIGELWANMGLPPEAALTPKGAIAAIALYRMFKGGSQAKPAPHTAATPPPAAPPAPPASPSDTASAAGMVEGRPTVASLPGTGAPSAEAARILAGLRASRTDNRTALLGFES